MTLELLPEIDAIELKEKMNSHDYILIDIREPWEWRNTGIIKNSKLIRMHLISLAIDNNELGNLKDKKLIIICRRGNRSAYITDFLRNKYNLDVINFKGGINSWKENNFSLIPYQ